MNHHFSAAVATAHQIHDRKHDGVAMAHFYASAAWEAQNNLPEAQHELETFLREDPKSAAAPQAHQMLQEVEEELKHPHAPVTQARATFTQVPSEPRTSPAEVSAEIRRLMQASKENAQIAEAEAEAECPACASTESSAPASPVSLPAESTPLENLSSANSGFTFRSSTDEVAVFFAATDHGRSVTNLTGQDVVLRDDRKAPATITGFRNESQLPLRLGLVIDSSASIAQRLKFEQDAAANFVRSVMTHPDDMAFVIGFANSILLVQDFTSSRQQISHAVGELAPSGGTSLWDAIAFASDKLANRPEGQPVARMLVVISDGEDNSSSATLKEAIDRAQHGEVAIYIVSTRDYLDDAVHSLVGEHALKTLAELTGGAAFTPGSAHRLNGTLADLQEIIRSRYLISYKPALFKRDGQYHAIDISVAKDSHKLRVYARKGYFAASPPLAER